MFWVISVYFNFRNILPKSVTFHKYWDYNGIYSFTRNTILFVYIGCPGRNVSDFGSMFLKLKYTDLTKNTYIRSLTVTEIMAREKCGLLAVPRTVPGSRDVLPVHTTCPSFSLQPGEAYSRCNCTRKVLGTP